MAVEAVRPVIPRTDHRIPSVTDYFPEVEGNLVDLTWAHAVNSQVELRKAMEDQNIMMLEADVILGKLWGHNETIPIMGHPPATQSDLSLDQFIQTVIVGQETVRKGIKLDFKSTDVFVKSWAVIDNLLEKLNFPVWLNADILPGPIDSDTTPVDAKTFLEISDDKLPSTTLSLGWTTKYSPSQSGSYSDEQIEAMRKAIFEHKVHQPVTLAMRAGLVAQNKLEVVALIHDIDQFQEAKQTTLTIWMSSDSDPVDVPKLKDLILTLTKSKVYMDVPQSLRDQLHLDNGAGVMTPVSVAQGVLVAILTSISALFTNVLKLF